MKINANKISELQNTVQVLTEQLNESKKTIETLTNKVNKAQQLKENLESDKNLMRRLTEEKATLSHKVSTLEKKLANQTKSFNEQFKTRTELAKSYKLKLTETLAKYVESKAAMLGVTPTEITRQLKESYTLADVDAVCDQILDSTISFSRLPFGGRNKTTARISESVSNTSVSRDPEYGYEIDDSLLELAGLKKY